MNRLSAFVRIDQYLSQRYLLRCSSCLYERVMFGTETEARKEAEKTGWEIRIERGPLLDPIPVDTNILQNVAMNLSDREHAFCPHCKHLVPLAPHHERT